MNREEAEKQNCSLANALNLIGDFWVILILREAFFGSSRFDDFQQHLGIARNILTARLKMLCEHGILQRIPIKTGARRHAYKLTQKGYDLYPVLMVLTQWGDRWLHQPGDIPMKFLDRATGEEIAEIAIQSNDGRKLSVMDIQIVPGPGATEETRERLRLLDIAWQQKVRSSKH